MTGREIIYKAWIIQEYMTEGGETPPEKPSGGKEQKPEHAPDHSYWHKEYGKDPTADAIEARAENFAWQVGQVYQKLRRDLTPRMVAAMFEDYKAKLEKRGEGYYTERIKLNDTQVAAEWLANEPLHMGEDPKDLDDESTAAMARMDQVAELMNETMEVTGEKPPEITSEAG